MGNEHSKCEFCKHTNSSGTIASGKNVLSKWEINIYPEQEIMEFNPYDFSEEFRDFGELFTGENWVIRYCPMCGKKLNENSN